MSEDERSPKPPAEAQSSMMRTLILVASVILVAAIGALLVLKFVLMPMLAEDNVDPSAPAPQSTISPTAVTVEFPESIVSVKMPPDSNVPASLLSFTVSLECHNPETAALVQAHNARFVDMINRQHEYKTRGELDDPRIKDSIQKAILLEANTILKQVQPPRTRAEIRVDAVFHTRFFVHDQL